MPQEKFDSIYERAAHRKGGTELLEQLIYKPLNADDVANISDDRWLAAFTEKVFQCGISWNVVRKKWPNFEEVFFNFDIEKMLMLPNEMWETKSQDPRIIRHLTKVMTIPANAMMINAAKREANSFSEMVAYWPDENITELWAYLKKNGKRLGGNTGAYTLRQMGKDTFILSSDVESHLRNTGIIDSGRDTKRSHQAANKAFNEWQQQSGRSLSEISQIVAYSCGDNRV
ncbi:DNA-3-methyladenine glycosylase I [Vibrio sp. 99-70-13A1]|uniref:DNA-3-methyladenine glycosylase I n=1 Tax=Vibrio sp. 99-70-13A1 TaxID=2607601 RepID=UPI001493D6EB|nr:DNA-3-methyladenine glycosylase I [Vibrio sp. 99-70-13A1]NOH96067.1 DNA-3-methyladenine glycosylase I [Vibrio sp. 99-70-13A1]